MTDNDDFLDDIDDDDVLAPILPHKQRSAENLLPRALIENAIGMDGINDISTREHFCLVVHAPSADWCDPICNSIRKMGKWGFYHVPPVIKRYRNETTVQQAVHALALGYRVLAVSHQPRRNLPPALLAAADMVLELPHPDARVVGAVIKHVTECEVDSLDEDVVQGLDFSEIAAAIRQGSSPEECISRLKKATGQSNVIAGVTDNVPHVSELYGYGNAQTWALDLIEDLGAWRRGEIGFDAIDRNAVLVSKPGMGKSTFARSLAKSCNVPLVATSVGEWFSNSPGHLDAVIKQIDQVFSKARSMAPSVLFLDELDAVPNRATLSPRGADWWLPVITHLLITLDSAISDAANNLIVVGATNYGDRLDSALIRPGRLEKLIVIHEPDAEDLVGIFRQHLGKDLQGEDLSEFGQMALGSSGAAVVSWVKAARRAARTAGRPMIMSDLVDAVAPASDFSPDLLRRIAVHEAGHATAAHVLRTGEVESVSIIRNGDTGGVTVTTSKQELNLRSDIENDVIRILAGRAAEEVVLGEPGSGAGGGESSDLAIATVTLGLLHLSTGLGNELSFRSDPKSIARFLAHSPHHSKLVEDHIQDLYRRAVELIRTNVGLVNRVADALIEKRVIDAKTFLAIAEPSPAPALQTKENYNG